MYLCRSAWQRLTPLTQRGTAALLRNAPARQMSAGSVPGSSGEAWPYYAFVAVCMGGAATYVYRTLSRDKARFHERHEYIETQLKPQLNSVSVKGVETENVEPEVDVVVEETSTVSEESSKNVEEVAQLSAPEELSELSAQKPEDAVEQETVELVAEAIVEETSPVLEARSANIEEEVASASEDWSELSAHKPEDASDDGSPAVQE